MKPLNILLFFLIIAIPLTILHDTRQSMSDQSSRIYDRYSDSFQAAVDDTAYYLSRLEAQNESNIHYASAKRLEIGEEALAVFYHNLAMKFGVGDNPIERQNLMLHIPAMVFLAYDGYALVTLEDPGQSELRPQMGPLRPYAYALPNGNVVHFTLDDRLTIYIKSLNRFVEGKHQDLLASPAYSYALGALTDLARFKEARQSTIARHLETDLGGAVNRHMELVQRMGLNVAFSLPRGMGEQSYENVGLIAFMQGYPLPGGERLDAYSYGGGAVVRRSALIGIYEPGPDQYAAYPEACAPPGAAKLEVFYDPEEAAAKGYYIRDCD